MKKLKFLFMVLLVLSVACGGPAAVEPSLGDSAASEETTVSTNAAEPDGETYFGPDGANFSLIMPSDWVVAEASVEGLAQMRSESSGLVSLTESFAQALIASGLELYAVNTAAGAQTSDFPPTIMVMRQTAPASLSLAELVADSTNQLADIVDLSSEIEQRSIMLGDSEAIMISYLMQVSPAGEAKTVVHNTQYYLVNDGDLYIITVEMAQELVEAHLASSRAIVETFRTISAE